MSAVVTTMLALLRLDDRQYQQGMKNAKNEARRFGNDLKAVGQSWQNFFNAAQMVSVPLGAALVKGVSDAASFDSALAQITARTGTTGDALDEVRKLAIQMGAETKFSAQDAANAMLELLSSGDDLTTAMERLPEVLKLAAAGSLDLKTSSDALTDVMAAFGLEADRSAQTVQALFSASASSSATVQDLIDGMGNVGPVARNFGLSVEETAAFLAVLSENGIKASEGGNALESMLTQMKRPTKEATDAWLELGLSMFTTDGQVKDLNLVLAELNNALSTRTEEDKLRLITALAGSYGQAAMSALLASDGITDMSEKMRTAANAGDVANASMDTFEGKLMSLQGSIETLNVVAFTPFMNNVLKPLVGDFTDNINKVTEFAEKNPELTQTVLTLAGGFVIVTGALTALGMGVKLVTTAVIALITTAFSPLGLALGVGAVLVAAYMNNWLGFRDFIDNDVRPAIDRIISGLQRWRDVMNDIKTIVDGINSGKYSVQGVLEAGKNAVVNEANAQFNRSGVAQTISSAQSGDTGGFLSGLEDAYNEFNNNPFLNPFGFIANQVNTAVTGARATGGGVAAGQMVQVNEDGGEFWRPDSSGEVIPLGDNRGGGGIQINVYQQPGENGEAFADRLARKMVAMGLARA